MKRYLLKKLIFSMLVLAIYACHGSKENKTNSDMNTELEKKMIKTGYRALFQTHREEMEKEVWKSGANKEKLEQIAYSKKTSNLGRFLAAEILRFFGVSFKKEHDGTLSEAYVHALKESNLNSDNYIGTNANSWGFLYEEDDPGYLGERLIMFGEEAVPFLIELLNDNGGLLYEGSEEATIGNAYRYRIKDFAAFYLSKIKDIPITFYQDLEERDKEIERFKKSLNTDR